MWQRLIDQFVAWDLSMWYYLHIRWRGNGLDAIIPFIRNQYFWAPIYLFLLFFVIINFSKRGWLWCAFYLSAFGLADYVSASIIKPLVHRPRPCNDELLKDVVQLLVNCGSGFSFPSSHAANHFAMSAFIGATLGKRFKWMQPLAWIWAILVAYAQVYVGVHFPLDVIFGGLWGVIVGLTLAFFFNKKGGFNNPAKL